MDGRVQIDVEQMFKHSEIFVQWLNKICYFDYVCTWFISWNQITFPPNFSSSCFFLLLFLLLFFQVFVPFLRPEFSLFLATPLSPYKFSRSEPGILLIHHNWQSCAVTAPPPPQVFVLFTSGATGTFVDFNASALPFSSLRQYLLCPADEGDCQIRGSSCSPGA